MKNASLTIISVVLFCAFFYGTYWIAKTLSYSIFYEDMVRQTVVEMVKESSLKELP